MPLYDCQCQVCGKVVEQLLRRDEDPTGCPQCLTPMTRKTVQVANFALKGGGWFRDGYAKGSGEEK